MEGALAGNVGDQSCCGAWNMEGELRGYVGKQEGFKEESQRVTSRAGPQLAHSNFHIHLSLSSSLATAHWCLMGQNSSRESHRQAKGPRWPSREGGGETKGPEAGARAKHLRAFCSSDLLIASYGYPVKWRVWTVTITETRKKMKKYYSGLGGLHFH